MILYVYRISALCCFQCSFPCPPDRFSGKGLFPVFSESVQPLWLEPLPAAKRCFRFRQRTFIVYHSLKALSTTFLFFYRLFTGALHFRASAFIYYQLNCGLSTTFLRFFYFFPSFPVFPSISSLITHSCPPAAAEHGRTADIVTAPFGVETLNNAFLF